MSVNVKLPDDSVLQVEESSTISQLASQISRSLGKKAVAGMINNKVVDLNTVLDQDCELRILTLDNQEGLEVYRHSTAHLLAQALSNLYPGVRLGIGPVIQDGFYYDIDLEHKLTDEDLRKIEKEMQRIVSQDLEIIREEISREEASQLFHKLGQDLKTELIAELPEGETITLYRQGGFVDLCRGPHLDRTGRIKAFKLMSVAGAYWRGDSNNKMLQRIYGTSWPSKAALEEHLHLLEEAKKRDHRKLGRELGLFMFSEESPGMPFYLPKGIRLRNQLQQFSRDLQIKAGYLEVATPGMMNQRLWEKSGHWAHYRENMYTTKADDVNYALKPMNCPGHMLIFDHELRSYKDLPLRLAEFGQVYRYELSGSLGGMTRVRSFMQDDAHIFVMPEQIEDEIISVMALINEMYSKFGFEYSVEFSTRPDKSMGSDQLWEDAELALENALKRAGVEYNINPGDGAFYGPKIDFHIRDALKRSHQCATIQLDFQLPDKFDLSYVGSDNEKHRPVVIHRAIFGSIERFIAILIEHYGGDFPVWLAPTQVRVISIADAYNGYAQVVASHLEEQGIRVDVDVRDEKIGYKIREAELAKIPFMHIVGDKETQSNQVTVRRRHHREQQLVQVSDALEMIKLEVRS